MSYRDWDQHDQRGTVRRRDEQDDNWDYKKRRRYDDNDYYEERGYRDNYRQNERYDHGHNYNDDGGYSRADDDWRTRQDPMEEDSYNDSYHQKHHHKGKRMIASESSQHVILLGLDPDFTEADMHLFLRSLGLAVENVTIIRDKHTGASRSFGFAQFPSIEEAQKFVEPNFPFINVPPPQSHGASAAQAFADGNGIHLGRRVKIDYSQSAGGHSARGPGGSRPQNDGTRDIGNSPAPIVLLRGLDSMTSMDAIAEALRASSGAANQGAIGMKRIVLIRDRLSAMCIGLAFVEFIDADSAGRLLGAIMSPELHPEGFRILNRPVAASYANPGSFQTLPPHNLRDEACIMGSSALGGQEGSFAKYWDEGTSIVEMSFDVASTVAKKEQAGQSEKKKKKKNKDDDAMISVDINEFMASAIKPEVKVSSTLPTNLKSLTLNMNKNSSGAQMKSAAIPKPATAALASAFTSADPDEPEPIPDNKPLDKAMTFRKVAPMIASKKVANSINKWNDVSQELRSGPAATATSQTPMTTIPILSSTPSQRQRVPPKETSRSDADMDQALEYCKVDTFTCYLCSRQLKSQDQLKRHVKESELHKKNLEDDNLRRIAREKVAKAMGTPNKSTDESKPVYRDRASERRIIHGQPDIPLPEQSTGPSSGGGGPSRKIRDVPIGAPVIEEAAKEPAKDENNIGNKLLKKMGWSEGTGLGLSGEGRVDPIQTAMYASGAGLGSNKGKDITKVAGLDYAGLVKESARERYEQK